MQPQSSLQTVGEVVAALGGTCATAVLTKVISSAVSNWLHQRGRFPARHFDVMTRALADKGYTAPATLWGMTES